MGALDSSKPRNMTATSAETYYKGYVYKVTTNAMTIITGKADTAVAVCDQSTVDSEQTARAARASEKLGFFMLGSGDIVEVASITGETYAVGAEVYLDDSVDGQVTATSATSKPIGHYVGDGATTASAGEIIEVQLDVTTGATNV